MLLYQEALFGIFNFHNILMLYTLNGTSVFWGGGVGWLLSIVLVLLSDISSNLLWQHPIFILSQYEYEMIPGQLKMNGVYDLLAFSGWWELSCVCQRDMGRHRALTMIVIKVYNMEAGRGTWHFCKHWGG